LHGAKIADSSAYYLFMNNGNIVDISENGNISEIFTPHGLNFTVFVHEDGDIKYITGVVPLNPSTDKPVTVCPLKHTEGFVKKLKGI